MACVFFAMPKVVLAIVLWAIGWSMIVLAGLVFLAEGRHRRVSGWR